MTWDNWTRWGTSGQTGAVAPVIFTSSVRFAATSSIKEEEETGWMSAMIALLFLDGRGAPKGGGAGDGLAVPSSG
jgi:hypothetical protein